MIGLSFEKDKGGIVLADYQQFKWSGDCVIEILTCAFAIYVLTGYSVADILTGYCVVDILTGYCSKGTQKLSPTPRPMKLPL